MPYYVLLYLVFCVLIGAAGMNYRFGFWGYFFAALVFSPIVAILLVLAGGPPRHVRRT